MNFLLRPVLLTPLVLCGCGLGEWARNGGKVGPNYVTPPADVAENWIDYRDPRLTAEERDLGAWWGIFGDPILNDLIEEAYQQNLSLRVAGERIAEARARRGVVVGNLLPQQQEAVANYTENKASSETANGVNEQWFSEWEAGFNVSWELDIWGRLRRSIEAADADLEASIADFDDVLVILLADVSANYVQYRTFQTRLAIARRNVEIQERSFQLADDKLRAGSATERDAQQARQVLEQTRATIPQLELGARRAANALCVLLGVEPQDLTVRLGEGAVPAVPPELAIGIPADLLRRRPDIRRIERQAAAQSALIGVAQSDLYPRFSLLGSIGVRGEDFGDLFDTPESISGFIGPGFSWDILNYGRIGNNVRVQEARFRQLVFSFQETVLRAGREAEDAAFGYLKAQERVRYLEASVAAAVRTVEITNDQYREGVIDFTPVFLFEETLAEQEDALGAAQGEIALSLIDLYRALGGGWETMRGDSTEPAPMPPTEQAEPGPTTTGESGAVVE